MMSSTKVKHLAEEILALPEHERQELAEGVLPELLLTRAGLEAIDQSLHSLSDTELLALVEHVRLRNREYPDQAVATLMDDAIQAARRARRS
ncbi:MAG: hypothetical protein MRJ68_22510 [Nitrospira sp.]|nr:hypothetical protein [Nitrospira sp.]